MSHKTLIGGTAYEITGGKTVIGGTGYSISAGKTLIGGTAKDILFEKVKQEVAYAGTFTSTTTTTKTLSIPSNTVGLYAVSNYNEGGSETAQISAAFIRNGSFVPIPVATDGNSYITFVSLSGTTLTYKESTATWGINNHYWIYAITANGTVTWTDGYVSALSKHAYEYIARPDNCIAVINRLYTSGSQVDPGTGTSGAAWYGIDGYVTNVHQCDSNYSGSGDLPWTYSNSCTVLFKATNTSTQDRGDAYIALYNTLSSGRSMNYSYLTVS